MPPAERFTLARHIPPPRASSNVWKDRHHPEGDGMLRNDPDKTRTGAGPEEEPELPLEEELDEAAELLPQQEPPGPEDLATPAELDPLLTDPAD